MATPIIKFPTTPHLLSLSQAVSRNDLVLSPADAAWFFARPLTLEEKLDGANLGISLNPITQTLQFQNRSHFVTDASSTQWRALGRWSENHAEELYAILEEGKRIVFGEWMWARHSILYDSLPDYFILFDIYDIAEGKYLSVKRRDALVEEFCGKDIPIVPSLGRDVVINGPEELVKNYLEGRKSNFSQMEIEGVYVRADDDRLEFLERRTKLVQAEFLQVMDDNGHWSKRVVERNKIRY